MTRARSQQTIADTEFVAFDLETTGLHPVSQKIVEVGAVRFRGDGTVLDRFQQLIDPQCPIPSEATGIHGITDSMVRGQPTLDAILPPFLAFLGPAETLLLAHHAPFDVGFLSVAMGRLNVSPPPHAIVDTCVLARRRLRLPNYQLETIGRHLRLIKTERHRAADDAHLLHQVFFHLVRGASDRGLPLSTTRQLVEMAPPLYFEDPTLNPESLPKGYEDFAAALLHEQPVSIEYHGGSRPGTRRVVTPKQLIRVGPHIYVTAWCHRDQFDKTFRLDRIVSYRKIE